MKLNLFRFILGIIAVTVAAVAVQQGEIPPYAGDGNPMHDGQPAWCQNTDSESHKHNCECQSMADKTCDKSMQESSKCKVYCRKTACKCKTTCDHPTE